MLKYHVTTEPEKRLISSWKYDGDYAIYNSISYEDQLSSHSGFGNPSNNYYSFCDGPLLVGYINLREKGTEVVLGVGVHPDLCNRGFGNKIVKMTCELSKSLFPGKPVYIEVRTWNERAVKCYEKAGFHIEGEPYEKTTPIGKGLFYRMQI
ncbi:GNAT family N-acetyltransferase [Butyrivibrio sp. YAB3001]|uniref:GNAT family N-acetyltransferase n=1 Tax=Butyrivibrio sp. YAB3001 TaxID=1520812 RepID=UPI0008F63D91|nr:GNAT family N-acetyltransferase [Butyrivibrio sp. YAB3001]SFD11405.1 Ribosomal protein S18 acetylase RimI [Butyrivibrio sp. YAB3001]